MVENDLQLQSDAPLQQPPQVLLLQREDGLLSLANLRDSQDTEVVNRSVEVSVSHSDYIRTSACRRPLHFHFHVKYIGACVPQFLPTAAEWQLFPGSLAPCLRPRRRQ